MGELSLGGLDLIERLHFLAFLPRLQILMQASEHWDVLMILEAGSSPGLLEPESHQTEQAP